MGFPSGSAAGGASSGCGQAGIALPLATDCYSSGPPALPGGMSTIESSEEIRALLESEEVRHAPLPFEPAGGGGGGGGGGVLVLVL